MSNPTCPEGYSLVPHPFRPKSGYHLVTPDNKTWSLVDISSYEHGGRVEVMEDIRELYKNMGGHYEAMDVSPKSDGDQVRGASFQELVDQIVAL